MINILFIAFEFPPLNRGGVHRPLAMVKYLPQFGINPVVITLHRDSYAETYDVYGYDEALGKETNSKATLIPVKAEGTKQLSGIENFMAIYFSIHGNEVKYWKEPFKKAAAQAIAFYKPVAIFATVPPFSVLPLVTALSKAHNLPLVLDFRDAWSQWRTIPYGSVFHYWKTLSLEGKYLKNAAAVIATSIQTLDDFKKLHPGIAKDKFHYIPNGYDGELMNWQPIASQKESFTIGYVGSFYYTPSASAQMLKPWWKKRGHRMLQYIPQKQDWLYRSPYFFFKAIQALRATHPSLAQKIRIAFVGKKQDWLIDMINDFGLENQVQLLGETSHKECLLFQQQCDALLITSAKQLGSKDYSIAGKTFEYLQMQKPVIAFVCEGAQKDLLAKAGTALICNPDDIDESAAKIAGIFSGAIPLQPDKAYLRGLSRAALTEQTATIIKKLSE